MVAEVEDALHVALVCGVSTDANSRSPQTDTSNWLPGHDSNATCVGLAGFEMSITRRPL